MRARDWCFLLLSLIFPVKLEMRLFFAQNSIGGDVFKVEWRRFEIDAMENRKEGANHENIKSFLDCIRTQ